MSEIDDIIIRQSGAVRLKDAAHISVGFLRTRDLLCKEVPRTPNQTTCNLLRSGRQIAVSTVEPVTELDRCRCVVMKKDQESNKGMWAVGELPWVNEKKCASTSIRNNPTQSQAITTPTRNAARSNQQKG